MPAPSRRIYTAKKSITKQEENLIENIASAFDPPEETPSKRPTTSIKCPVSSIPTSFLPVFGNDDDTDDEESESSSSEEDDEEEDDHESSDEANQFIDNDAILLKMKQAARPEILPTSVEPPVKMPSEDISMTTIMMKADPTISIRVPKDQAEGQIVKTPRSIIKSPPAKTLVDSEKTVDDKEQQVVSKPEEPAKRCRFASDDDTKALDKKISNAPQKLSLTLTTSASSSKSTTSDDLAEEKQTTKGSKRSREEPEPVKKPSSRKAAPVKKTSSSSSSSSSSTSKPKSKPVVDDDDVLEDDIDDEPAEEPKPSKVEEEIVVVDDDQIPLSVETINDYTLSCKSPDRSIMPTSKAGLMNLCRIVHKIREEKGVEGVNEYLNKLYELIGSKPLVLALLNSAECQLKNNLEHGSPRLIEVFEKNRMFSGNRRRTNGTSSSSRKRAPKKVVQHQWKLDIADDLDLETLAESTFGNIYSDKYSSFSLKTEMAAIFPTKVLQGKEDNLKSFKSSFQKYMEVLIAKLEAKDTDVPLENMVSSIIISAQTDNVGLNHPFDLPSFTSTKTKQYQAKCPEIFIAKPDDKTTDNINYTSLRIVFYVIKLFGFRKEVAAHMRTPEELYDYVHEFMTEYNMSLCIQRINTEHANSNTRFSKVSIKSEEHVSFGMCISSNDVIKNSMIPTISYGDKKSSSPKQEPMKLDTPYLFTSTQELDVCIAPSKRAEKSSVKRTRVTTTPILYLVTLTTHLIPSQ